MSKNKIMIPQDFNEYRYPGSTSTIHLKPFVLNRARRPYLEFEDPTPGIVLEGEQKAARDDIVDWIIHPDVDDRVLTIGGWGGTGKAQPIDSLVFTPSGPKRMGEIREGDEVSTPDGSVARVIGVFPQGVKKIYRFWFDDNTYADSCGDHLWKVIDARKRQVKYTTPVRIYTTDYIVAGLKIKSKGRVRFYIPTGVCYFTPKKLIIEPYLMGVLLGDDSFKYSSFSITSVDSELLDRCRDALRSWSCHLKNNKWDVNTWLIVGDNGFRGVDSSAFPLRFQMRELGLWGKGSEDKFIPRIYLESSLEDRWELLQGLMDTDGTVDSRTGMASYTSTSYQLALDVQWLVNSMGGKATIKSKNAYCVYKGEKKECKAFDINVRMNETSRLFKLSRKRELARDRTKYKIQRCIRSAEYIGEKECQCILIDHPDHLYMTDSFIPTHNTIVSRHIQAYLQALGIRHAVVSLTGNAVEVLRKKGVSIAQTIHSCLYTVDEVEKKKTGRLAFIKNHYLDYEVIIIDEAQILPNQAYHDFMSFPYIRLIAFGDHGQLRSIGGDNIKLMENPRIRLEEIRRQALESNIVKFAHAIREGKTVKYGKCDQVLIAPRKYFMTNISDPNYDMIVVGFNRTRHQVNREVRRYRGYHGDIPNVGERVTSHYNHKGIGLYNGQMFIVKDVSLETDELVRMTLDSYGTIYTVLAVRDQFGHDKIDLSYSNKFFKQGYRSVVFMDYAYAITGHKAMGSEYPKGKVLEEVHPDEDVKRWGYTTISRFYEDIQYFR